MKLVIRADSGPHIGGGHVMRCLSLATAARDAGHQVLFLCADLEGDLTPQIQDAGFDFARLKTPDQAGNTSPTEHWHPMPAPDDAAQSSNHCKNADWVILDHYGLGGDWVRHIRKAAPHIRVLALDDFDREPLFADMILDPAHLSGPRRQPRLSFLAGPKWALLRPEFAELRATALARPLGRKLLILPGMMDAAGMAPAALDALAGFPDLTVDVIMGHQSQSRASVEARVASNPNWSLHLDVQDMATRMAAADYCIGAGGGTAWERCCLGLATVAIAVAENQKPGVAALGKAGAAIGLDATALHKPDQIAQALKSLIDTRSEVSNNAAALCDGLGARRVIDALSGSLRPVTQGDAKLLFEWRNQPHIRAVSLNSDPLIWDEHSAYIQKIIQKRQDGLWSIYCENNTPLGHVNARAQGNHTWYWSFYVGALHAAAGTGKRMLTAFLRQLLKQPDFQRLTAQVTASNPVSISLHKGLGFRCNSPEDADILDFTLDRADIETRFGLTHTKGAS